MSVQSMDVYFCQLMDAKKVLTPARASDHIITVTQCPQHYQKESTSAQHSKYHTGCPQCHHKKYRYQHNIASTVRGVHNVTTNLRQQKSRQYCRCHHKANLHRHGRVSTGCQRCRCGASTRHRARRVPGFPPPHTRGCLTSTPAPRGSSSGPLILDALKRPFRYTKVTDHC